MKILVLLCAVLALGSFAPALDFRVQGAVDMGGAAGNGSPISGDFTGIFAPAPHAAFGVGARIGDVLSVGFGSTPIATESSFEGWYFTAGGQPSQINPAGRDGVAIFDAASDFPITAPAVRVYIRDANGLEHNVQFNGVGTHSNVALDGITLSQTYRLAQYGRTLYVEAIPTPGALSLFGIGLIASSRRRR
ncbi:MAG: hypothetical protein R3B46_05895 [Phycisphaerales bacterium]